MLIQFLFNRVINDWNNLPSHIVDVESLNSFKTIIDSYLDLVLFSCNLYNMYFDWVNRLCLYPVFYHNHNHNQICVATIFNPCTGHCKKPHFLFSLYYQICTGNFLLLMVLNLSLICMHYP